MHQAVDRMSPEPDRRTPENPVPPPGFSLWGRLSISDREPRADSQGGKLIDRVAARAPVRALFFREALGHARMPFEAGDILCLYRMGPKTTRTNGESLTCQTSMGRGG